VESVFSSLRGYYYSLALSPYFGGNLPLPPLWDRPELQGHGGLRGYQEAPAVRGLRGRKESEVPPDQPQYQSAEELRRRREAWELRERPEQPESDRPEPQEQPEPRGLPELQSSAPQDRRVNRVQLARLAVPDLLALLGLPLSARPELRGRPARPDHQGPPVLPGTC
jgi:hypothetical protein